MERPGKVYVGVSKQRALKLPFPSLTQGVGTKVSHYCAGETEARQHHHWLNNVQLTNSRGGVEMQKPEAPLAISGP